MKVYTAAGKSLNCKKPYFLSKSGVKKRSKIEECRMPKKKSREEKGDQQIDFSYSVGCL